MIDFESHSQMMREVKVKIPRDNPVHHAGGIKHGGAERLDLDHAMVAAVTGPLPEALTCAPMFGAPG